MIVVHHLAFSRSNRVIWLLEELGLPYRLVRYERDENFRAPAALAAVHPLGKAPVIEDGGLVLAESSVILSYIDGRHGGGRFSPPRYSDAWYAHEEWLQYAESTAAFPIMVLRIGVLSGGPTDRLEAFVMPTLVKTLNHIERQIGERDSYLTGDGFMLADLQLAYPLEIAEHAGMLAKHPRVRDYLQRLKRRPAFQKAVEIGGPMLP